MATVISSTFQIIFDVAASQPTTNLATARGMRVVSVLGTGVDNAVITVNKVSSAGAVQAMAVCTMENAAGGGVDSLTDQAAVMDTVANCTMLSTDTIRIIGTVANMTRCVITAVAETGQTVVES